MKDRKLRGRQVRWERLDNTANLFPAIASQNMTNVYRIAVTLKEEIDGELLQQALDKVLPRFDTFRVRMRKGLFWYYFETNTKPAPTVRKEKHYPCRYIEPSVNNDFSDETSLNTEDSYVKNYKKGHKKGYQTKRAVEVKGENLLTGEISVMHGFMPVKAVKSACKKYDVSINEYFTAVFLYSIYMEYLHGQPSAKPIAASIPVNLRPYFNSQTTRNFFVMVSAIFAPDRENIPLEEVMGIVKESLRSQINKEHLEELFSYNVSNQKNIFLRFVPIFIKILAMRFVYRSSARANTTTVTNIGKIQIKEAYQPYIRHFYAMISRSVGQSIKGAVCSYQDTIVFTITSGLYDVSIQRCFFRTLAGEDIPVVVETNGVQRKEER